MHPRQHRSTVPPYPPMGGGQPLPVPEMGATTTGAVHQNLVDHFSPRLLWVAPVSPKMAGPMTPEAAAENERSCS